jgi:diaminohydroxyphosphoribosylaminopyrimidine deaminase / 5-amino-6-(5-phosphoribosylamino)uracil reductase
VSFSGFDHECMALALALAARGMNSTRPNPRVGCVLARDGRVIASGWHVAAGSAHAEVVALESAGGDAQGATAYVTLEPCSHHGRTPPCVDALLSVGVVRVVCAIEDPNVRVNGVGLRRLQEAGVQVDCGLMASAAEELNAGFLMRMRAERPWVRVKLASSLDGRTALANGLSQWISGEASRADVQRWRARSCAILTGIGTVLADDPALTARLNGVELQPLRVVADTQWRTPPNSRILLSPVAALVAGSRERTIPAALAESGAECLPLPEVDGRVDLHALLRALAIREINEVQVEAGADLCGALLMASLVDEIVLYQAPVLLGKGGPGLFNLAVIESMRDRAHLRVVETRHFGDDMRLRLRPLSNQAGSGLAGH